MRFAIIDDDEILLANEREMLLAALSQLGIAIKTMDLFHSGEEFLSVWKKGDYDVVLLDIYMDELNGVDVARKIRESDADVTIAFCTSSNEFASESYEIGAGYYLQKPVSQEKIAAMLKRLNLSKIERNRTIKLPDGHLCLLRHVIYTEYSNHSVIFHLKHAAPHSVYMNHSDAEAMLLHYKNFKQINKGCIVNFALVKKLTSNSFLMQNGESLPIARRRYKEVSEAYTQFHFDRMDEEVNV